MAAPADRLQEPYLTTLNVTTSEHLNLYNNSIVGLPESDRCDMTSSKYTDFYQ